jgi:hypothetical protein
VFEQRHFLRFHNAVNSGRTCIYFGKLFKNDVLRPLQTVFFKFRRQAPVKSVIAKMIKKFHETGSLLEKNLNRQKSVITPGILQDIQTVITRSPHKSLRKLSAQMGISLGSAHSAVRKMLKFYPYQMQVFHELIPGDHAKRVNYCRWFKNLIHGNIGVLDKVFLQMKSGSTLVVT